MGTFKGVARRAWYENQLLWRSASQILESFEAAGIPCLVIDGAALAASIYPESGLRPLRALDLFIPARDAVRAVTWLQDHCWTPANRTRNQLERQLDSEIYKATFASQYFRHTGGNALRLHWHPLSQRPTPLVAEQFWKETAPTQVNNKEVRTLSATAELVRLCTQDLEARRENPAQWIADSVILLRHAPKVDWNRVVELAQVCGISRGLSQSLAYLRENFSAPVPATVLEDLHAVPTSKIEMLETTLPPANATPRARTLARYQQYSASTNAPGATHPRVGLVTFLQHLWGLENQAKIPGYVLQAGRSHKSKS
jgi:hypothetical protein